MNDKPCKTIAWTRPMVERFRKAYNAAVKDRKEQFTFDENEFVTSYAKYLLEYLDTQLTA